MTFVVRFLGQFLVCHFAYGYRVAAFFEKAAHLLAFVVKVGVATKKVP